MDEILRLREDETKRQTELKTYAEEIQKLENEKSRLEPELTKLQAHIGNVDGFLISSSFCQRRLETRRQWETQNHTADNSCKVENSWKSCEA